MKIRGVETASVNQQRLNSDDDIQKPRDLHTHKTGMFACEQLTAHKEIASSFVFAIL